MNATIQRTFAVPLAALALTANAYETAISDTTGYVVQNASDGFNQNSLVAGAHFPGGAPVPGKHYLVNNGLNTRTPPTDNASNTFKGDSLTLDGGANLMLKGKGSTFTVNNLIVYNALVTQSQGGNTTVTLGGNMTAKGTASAPSIVQGNADGGARRINLTSAISGDATARIKVQHVEGDSPDREGHQFYTHFMGNNSAYAGSIEVEGGGNGVCLVGYGNTSFGSSPAITLSQNGKLFGGGNGGAVSLSGAAITLDGGGTLGVYKNGSSSQGLILSGGTISGSGMLTINNSGAEGTHDRRVVLGNVAISGIDGIVVQGGVLQLGTGYSNPTTPITMAQSKMLRTAEGISVGPVTLQAESFMNLSGESVTLASLTFDQTDDTPPYIIKLLRAGCITVTGDITNRLVSGQKMRIDFNDNLDSIKNQFKTVKSFRILSAANLGEPGVTADDFVATSSAYDATGYVAAFVTNGTFSIETDGATKYLVYTLDRNAVVSTGTDVTGQCSFMADTHWSDSATPHDTADYFILSGHEIRTKEKTTSKFGGHSLSVLSGGSLALVGNASGIKSTVGDLRLYGGAILTAKRNWGNYLDGNITVNGTAATPVVFQTEWASNGEGDTTTARTLHVSAAVSGGGSIRCQYQGPVFNPERPAVLKLLGDNNGFTGQWQIMHPAAQATFTSAASVGAASAIAFNSNGVFHAEGASFAIPAATEVIVNNIGGVSGSEDLTNGGTFEVDDALTLTVSGVVSGSGILRKTGAGTLLLDAENTLAGPLVVSQGLVGGAGKVGAVELADGAGFRVSATQAAPFEIGTLTIDGDIALDIANFAAANADRIAVAKVGTLSGMLPGSPVSMTIDGRKSKSLWLSLSGGVIYAERSPFVIIVR